MPMHYGGVACDMEVIHDLAGRHGLQIIEDAAHALLADYRGRRLGAIGHSAAISFHETKNVMCGEGGALLINEPSLVERSEILLEKGTNRSAFLRGEVGRYHWLDLGSSYGASELTAGFLWAQFEAAEEITRRRRAIWSRYHECLEALEVAGKLRRPRVPDYAEPNGHLYYVLLEEPARRDQVMDRLRAEQIIAPIHYVPLHSAPAGRRYGRIAGPMDKTEDLANRLIRLPFWLGMEDRVEEVVERLGEIL
jgi:dTDP-4-amino-4,6-dideoxygalactose transaminase